MEMPNKTENNSISNENPVTSITPEEPIITQEETIAAPEEITVAPEEPIAMPEEAAVASEETVAAPEETAVAPEETVAAPEETAVAPEETVSAPEEEAVVPEETVSAPEEAAVVPEEPVAMPEETAIVPEETVAAPEETAPAPKKSRAKLWILLAVVAAAAIIGISVGVHLYTFNKNYEAASELFAQEKYQEAADAFAELKNYKDSAAMQELASLWAAAVKAEKNAKSNPDDWEAAATAYEKITDDAKAAEAAKRCHNTAIYYQATALMDANMEDPESLREAADLFRSCGGIQDADDKAELCENFAVYYTADALLAEGPDDPETITEALGLFEECYGTLDSGQRIHECELSLAYIDAKALMDEQKWEEAKDAFDPLASEDFRDSNALRAECAAHITYAQADALYQEGKYYDAYKLFHSMEGKTYEGLTDMAERAKACIQPMPSNGVVYQNSSYTAQTAQLTIDNSGFMNTFIKIYSGDTLVRSVFIAADGEATFYIPSGTYRMNQAYGETWFGETDLFGDEGYYWNCSFEGSDTFTLEYGYGYSISAGNEGTNISNSATDRDSL